MGRGERASGQRVTQLAGGVGPAHERIGVVHTDNEPVQSFLGNQAAGGLDLGKFWHLTVLLAPLTGVPVVLTKDPTDMPLTCD
jgi:hypothetical protein